MSRLEQLQKLYDRTPGDPFLTYGLALEYKKMADYAVAVEWLDKTIALDANYCYAYYQKGQVLELTGRDDEARAAYTAGIAAATVAGDAHAKSELQTALDILG